MSARAAVFTLLTTDSILNSVYGINAQRVWPAESVDTPPRSGRFLILRWEELTREKGGFGTREVLTVWAHQARESSTDFVPLIEILDRVEEILQSAIHVEGVDGTLTQVTYDGRSPDLNDEVYKTITKNSAFRIGSR